MEPGRWIPWEELRTDQLPPHGVGEGAPAPVAVLPVAAVEQHGPHLPLGTDAMILDAVLEAAGEHLPGDVLALRLPTWRIGHSPEHTSFPGTLHVAAETTLAAWTDVGRAVARAGIRRLALCNSHGGQVQLVDLAAQRLRSECGMAVARITTFALGAPEGLFSADELRYGLHGGEVETSMMLAARPELVNMEAAGDFRSAARDLERGLTTLEVEGATGIGWRAEDLHPGGATGNAAAADAERGRALLDHLGAAVAGTIGDLARLEAGFLEKGD